MSDPLYIERAGHRARLKWHRGRRRPSDPAFTGARILEAMRLGASAEVDLVIHASHGCAVLHDKTLDRETTGTGPVRAASAETIRALKLRGNDNTPLDEPVLLLEDLCALLAEHKPHPEALLQLDFKEDFDALDPQTIANFAASVAPVAGAMILTGGDAKAINALTQSVPALRSGYDPCYGDSLARLQATGDYESFVSGALQAAPDAAFIYLHHEIVLAADRAGYDIIAAIHAGGRQVDAWTISTLNSTTISQVARLLELKADQITTDDPEGLAAAFDP